jgi:putative PEP-CTERM system histidine kinase
LEPGDDQRAALAESFNPGGAFLCVPIRSERQLLGFITLSRQQGARYGQDDFDLLRAIAHHAGMLLSLADMAEDRRAAGELEALHRFSAFCLHDLKNLAQKLSLVVQNAQVHGEEPAFQQSVMRTVSGTVQKMTGLITKLSVQSAPTGAPESVDVSNLITETISSMNGELRVVVNSTGKPAAVRIVRDQLQQVLLNLVLNAQQADGERRQSADRNICIDTEERDGTVIITVTDQGPGIPPEKLQTLFQPFHTTKSSGLGLGLYQCKRIIEDHGGSIRVQSEVGRGTEVRIELPATTRT